MQPHYWEKAESYEVKVNRGFVPLLPMTFTSPAGKPVLDFRYPVEDKLGISKQVFGLFERCLYERQKFDSDTERRLAVILDRESARWFRPAKGQFNITYKWKGDLPTYRPDFVAETTTHIYMLETKASNEMEDPEVLAKRDAAQLWCERASAYSAQHGGKPWVYALIPHDIVKDNMSIEGLISAAKVISK
jgi:type III restriction enzyme